MTSAQRVNVRRVLSCPACGSEKSRVAKKADQLAGNRFRCFSRQKYRGIMDNWLEDLELVVLCCSECGHHWYRDQPDSASLGHMYAAAVPLGTTQATITKAMVARMAALRSLVSSKSPTLLDYGSGAGRWCAAAVQAGFAVTGFEPNPSRVEDQAKPYRLVSNVEELTGEKFDAVNIEQVLEHIPNPLNALAEVRPLLKSRAVVLIRVPNFGNAARSSQVWDEWPFDGQSPHIIAPFEHLNGFSGTSLRSLVKRAGFRPASPLRVARQFPVYAVRSLLRGVPRLRTTEMIAEPA